MLWNAGSEIGPTPWPSGAWTTAGTSKNPLSGSLPKGFVAPPGFYMRSAFGVVQYRAGAWEGTVVYQMRTGETEPWQDEAATAGQDVSVGQPKPHSAIFQPLLFFCKLSVQRFRLTHWLFPADFPRRRRRYGVEDIRGQQRWIVGHG